MHEIENHVVVEIEGEVDARDLVKQSGGIVKLSSLRGAAVTKQSSISEMIATSFDKLRTRNDNNKYKNFGVSLVGFQENVVRICEELKKGLKMHYILPKVGYELSSAQIINKNVLEFTIVKKGDEYQFFQTQCVQDINYWTKKDTGRPFIDDRLGMLPLKVARMMVNLGRGGENGDVTLLDPFCGMGSILAEAADLGIRNVVGSDINPQVLEKCRQNIDWFKEEFKYQHIETSLFVSDAAKISDKLNDKIDLIVTEPFLGDARKIQKLKIKNKNDSLKLKNIVRGLDKMYTGCLKDWKKILRPNAVVVIIVPEIELDRKVFTVPFVEICSKTGYNIIGQYDYAREKAIVKRKIYLLKI